MKTIRCIFLLQIGLLFSAGVACATDLPVYDDALRSGFQDWSWGGGINLSNTTPVHAGTRSIALTGNNFNAISLAKPGAGLSPAAYPTLQLWIHGGNGNNQSLTLFLQDTATSTMTSVPLNAYIAGGGPTAGTWKLATVSLATAFPSITTFDRIDIQSNSGGTQATVYIDDIVLKGAAGPDPIFADGFDGSGPPAANGLAIEHDVSVDGIASDRFTWRDRDGLPRVAVLAHNNGGTASNGSRGGELREFRYQVGGGTRIARATSGGAGGFGYVVSHPYSGDYCTAGATPGGSGSSLGHAFSGQFQRVFEGRHHAILRFTQNYPRYCTNNPPAQTYNVPVTIDWVFATGRSDPLWSITWDLSGIPVDRLQDDSRAPYGELRFDGAANDNAMSTIAGVGWGDYYKFNSSTNPVTFSSAWTWNTPNTVPYVKLWTSAVDATMGIVQTQTISQQDAGGYWGQDSWGKTSAQGSGCPGYYLMPCDYNWPYQSINYSLSGSNVATSNTRLAWGTNFGFLGQQSYPVRGNAQYGGGALALPGNPTASGWPKKSYSTWIVLGTHSSDPVGKNVTDVEIVQSLTLTAQVGSVAANGPSGIADATIRAYTPLGWNPVYGALTFDASGNRLDANIKVGSGTLRHPLLIVRGFSSQTYPTLTLNGQALVRDQDWFPSLRGSASELWITLNRDLTGASNRIVISP